MKLYQSVLHIYHLAIYDKHFNGLMIYQLATIVRT
jgi:hypothetical protein